MLPHLILLESRIWHAIFGLGTIIGHNLPKAPINILHKEPYHVQFDNGQKEFCEYKELELRRSV